jgi:tRNA(His) guanylyltransferase
MNTAAKAVVADLPEITIAYGISDEYRLVMPHTSHFSTATDMPQLRISQILRSIRTESQVSSSIQLIQLRLTVHSKLVTTVVSTFTANYVYAWSTHFPDTPLTTPLPTFDGRAVCYPSVQNLRDYMSWRQADCEYMMTLM